MDFLLDLERVVLAMVAGAVIFFVAVVRPNVPEDVRDPVASRVWPRFNVLAMAAAALVIVLATVRLADGEDRALVHVMGGALLFAVVLVKSRLDARIAALVAGSTGSEGESAAIQQGVARVIPMVVAVMVLCLGLALGPA